MNFRYACAVANDYLGIWGDWIGRHMQDWHGLPHVSPYVDGGSGRGGFGSRMLIAPMPKRVGEVSRVVESLPQQHKDALWAHYVYTVTLEGRSLSVEERAKLMRISLRTYQYRVGEARKRVARTVFGMGR